MKRAKLIFDVAEGSKGPLIGSDVHLVDAETGDEILCCGNITIECPIKGVVIANVGIQISELEIRRRLVKK